MGHTESLKENYSKTTLILRESKSSMLLYPENLNINKFYLVRMASSSDDLPHIEPDILNECVKRISSFPANFETKLENNSLNNQQSLSLHNFINVCAEESHHQDEEDVNLIRLSRNHEYNGECAATALILPDCRLDYPLDNMSPCSFVSQEGRPLSPFSMMNSVPWFSSREDDCNEETERADSEKECRDDDISVNSEAYYEPADFDTSNWIKASMNVPTVGLAILVVSTAIMHPLLFILGALTAYGTATAAAKGYGYFFHYEDEQSSIWQSICGGGTNACEKKDEQLVLENRNINFATIQVENGKNSEGPSLASTNDSSSTNNLINDNDSAAGAKPPDPVIILESLPNNLLAHSTFIESSRMLADDWAESNYPELKNTVIQDCPIIGLNTVEFFRVFLDDDAPYNFKVFQEKRGDIDIQYGNWKHLPESGLSLIPSKSDNDFPTGLEYHSFQGRVLTFKARTNSFIGPPWATTRKTQRMLILSKRLAILESRTDLSDIPFCDKFFVMERWVLKARKELDRYVTYMTATSEVHFTGYCAFESQIRSKTAASIRDIIASWYVMATEALKLTEQSKLDRLNNSHADGSEIESAESADEIDTKAPSGSGSHRRICSNESIEITEWVESSQRTGGSETSPHLKTETSLAPETKIPTKQHKGTLWTNLRRNKMPPRPIALRS